ncbi:hypothetical protein AKJ64_01960 [candidate division MSBL1 archaeon SCGC-AAA259E17]|uniref:Uridylate kinase n=1 Tax=candidate division MSBL1 archaeon SCGC-AAA259E17 TaxID=1698263 RepID=A0A133UFC0_9EURY|nr:hypothetical protein AKJ64_01960 [candidate division MSBL1 archaeon SCGC-AAA259E17]
MRITICFGGSTFNPEELEVETLKEIAEALKELKKENHEILVVTGGGYTSRYYIEAGEELGIPHKDLDQIGIAATRLNARLLNSVLGDLATEDVPRNFEKAIRTMLRNKIPVMGGTQPGHTTDAVAAELAETSNSDLLIFISDVDGIYTSDPKKNEGAEKIYQMTTSELSDLMSKMKFEPGMNAIIDPLATEILQGMKIKTLVIGKNEINRLPQIVKGSTHSGTVVEPPEKTETDKENQN